MKNNKQEFEENKDLYKMDGVFWKIITNDFGNQWVYDTPLCSVDSCRAELSKERGLYYCIFCKKEYSCPHGYIETIIRVRKKWEAFELRHSKVYSLELPPTKIIDESEDENYWVQARLGEKDGKRMAVIYFGKKIRGVQDKKDYVQTFVDIEEEQVRFDKNNKNPMELLIKLTAEFPGSTINISKK